MVENVPEKSVVQIAKLIFRRDTWPFISDFTVLRPKKMTRRKRSNEAQTELTVV